jgi:glycerol-3-phosphate dehydrogenase
VAPRSPADRPPATTEEEVGLGQRYDAVIIGGGHNGLVSAAYLARPA